MEIQKPSIHLSIHPSVPQAAAQIDANADVTFVPYFLVSEVEPLEDTGFSEHERELLLCYTHTTGHDLRQEVSAKVNVYVCGKLL